MNVRLTIIENAIVASLYEILGVDPKVKPSTLRNAYRKLAREFHPDVNPDPRAHERMAQINAAFETLNDPDRRNAYDMQLMGSVVAVQAPAPPSVRDQVSVTLVRRLKDHRTPIYCITFEPETDRMISSSFDNQILWWNSDFEVRNQLRLEGGVVNVVHSQAPNQAVAAGCSESLISAWQIQDGMVQTWRNTPLEWICCVAVSPDGSKVALGSLHHTVQAVRAATGDFIFSSCRHDDSVTAVAWSPDGQYLASGSADATVRIWNAQNGKLVQKFTNVRSTVSALCWSPDSTMIAAASVDRSIRLFHIEDPEFIKTFFGHEKPIEAIAFHPDGQLLATVGRDGHVWLWNVLQGRGHGKIEASNQPLSTVAFSHDGSYLVAGGLDKIIRVWSLRWR